MSRYICSEVDISNDRRYFWLWDSDEGPVAKGLPKADFIRWIIAYYPQEFSEKRIRNAEVHGCSSAAYLFDELVALTQLDYEEFWRVWT